MTWLLWLVHDLLWDWVAHPVHLLGLRVDDAVLWIEREIERRYPRMEMDWHDFGQKEEG